MRQLSYVLISALAVSSLAAGCRSGDDANGDDDGSDGGVQDAPSGGVSIPMIHDVAMAPGTSVSVYGKVITAKDNFGHNTGNVWISETGGGSSSGILVFGVGSADFAAVSVGDLVNVTGAQKENYTSGSDTSGLSDTELGPLSSGSLKMTKAGTGTAPTPFSLDALSIGQMSAAARGSALEPQEGTLVTVSNVLLTSKASCYASASSGACDTGSGSGMDEDSFGVTGVFDVEDSLAAFPSSGLTRGVCAATITGVVDYFYVDGFEILPRSSADIVLNGTGCPAIEQGSGSAVCTDGIDNDGNGYTDCADLGCSIGSNAYLGSASCVGGGEAMCGCAVNDQVGSGAAQLDGLYSATGSAATASTPTILNDVYVLGIVTGTASVINEVLVSDSTSAAMTGSGHAVEVVFNPSLGSGTLAVGQKITVEGLAELYTPATGTQPVAELYQATLVGTPSSAVSLAASTVTDLTIFSIPPTLATAAGNAYDSSLAKLTGTWIVTSAATATGDPHNQVTLSNGTTSILMDDDDWYGYGGGSAGTLPAMGRCYSSITGTVNYNVQDYIRTINPRSSSDLVAALTGTVGTTMCLTTAP